MLIVVDLFILFPADAGGAGGKLPEGIEGVSGGSLDESLRASIVKGKECGPVKVASATERASDQPTFAVGLYDVPIAETGYL